MISPIHRNSMASCVFEFWYYIAGITTDLQPVLKSKNLNKDLVLDKLKPDSESVGLWRKSVNGIGRQREDFQLRISLEPSKTFDAGVAIDDCGDSSDEVAMECELTKPDSFEDDDNPFGLF